MSTFVRRLKYYGFGFGLGVVIVFFFFGNRSCNWGPEARVKAAIMDRVLVADSVNKAELLRRGISTSELKKLIEEAEIDFSQSKKEESIKVYYMQSGKFAFLISMPYESFIAEVNLIEQDAHSYSTNSKGIGSFLYFPKEQDFIYVPENELLESQMKEMGFKDNNALLHAIKTNGFIDFSRSNFNIRPKPEHSIRFIDEKNRKIEARAIWMKERMEVISFTFDSILPRK